MKNIKNTIGQTVLAIILVTVVACNSSKKNSKTNVVEEVKQEEAKSVPVEVTYSDPAQQRVHEIVKLDTPLEETSNQEKIKVSAYAFTASFFSTGEGSDGKMIQRFKDFITSYNTEKNVNLVYNLNYWGREGEADFCFQLTELSQDQRADFIQKSKDLLSGSKLVHVAENGQCHPNRR